MQKLLAVFLVLAMMFTVSACDDRQSEQSTTENPAQSQSVETSQSETPDIPSVDTPVSGALDVKFREGVTPLEGEKFVDAVVGYERVYGLTNQGNVYVLNTTTAEVDLFMDGVLDIGEEVYSVIFLTHDGLISVDKFTEERSQKDLPDDENIVSISENVAITAEGSGFWYDFEGDSWHKIPMDFVPQKLLSSYNSAVMLDAYNTLWKYDFYTDETQEIAGGVIDFSFSEGDKVHYTSDIAFITADKTLHVWEHNVRDGTTLGIRDITTPYSMDTVMCALGNYIARLDDGSYVRGSFHDPTTEDIKIIGYLASFNGYDILIIDQNGALHYDSGTVPEVYDQPAPPRLTAVVSLGDI